jgi:hypothetical protein
MLALVVSAAAMMAMPALLEAQKSAHERKRGALAGDHPRDSRCPRAGYCWPRAREPSRRCEG